MSKSRASLAPLPVLGFRKDGRPIYPIAGADGTEPGNPVITRLEEERAKQTELMDGILATVEDESRDLVDAEIRNLEAIRERIKQLDAQLEPLREFEETRAAGQQASRSVRPSQSVRDRGDRLAGRTQPRGYEYRSAGEVMVDIIRAQGFPGEQLRADDGARDRLTAALGRDIDGELRAHQTTGDTPGLMPENIVGQILTDIDGARPFITSLGGAKSLSGVPGKVFHRPIVTQHTTTGRQTEEKGELPSRQFQVDGIPFTKETFGGWLNVSRQSIDWTSPSAWNALLEDLQLSYSEDTDEAAAEAFAEGVDQEVEIPENRVDDIKYWVRALYAAARVAATADGTVKARTRRLPNGIWVSIDQWELIGSVIDVLRVTQASNRDAGQTSPTSFAGSILDIPRTVVPGAPDGTVIVGRSDRFEFHEERIGLLSVVEPKVLGVEIAYGGYGAHGFLDDTTFARIVQGEPVEDNGDNGGD